MMMANGVFVVIRLVDQKETIGDSLGVTGGSALACQRDIQIGEGTGRWFRLVQISSFKHEIGED